MLRQIERYDAIFTLCQTKKTTSAINAIFELPDNKLTEFIRYCTDRLECTYNAEIKEVWRKLIEYALEYIDTNFIKS